MHWTTSRDTAARRGPLRRRLWIRRDDAADDDELDETCDGSLELGYVASFAGGSAGLLLSKESDEKFNISSMSLLRLLLLILFWRRRSPCGEGLSDEKFNRASMSSTWLSLLYILVFGRFWAVEVVYRNFTQSKRVFVFETMK